VAGRNLGRLGRQPRSPGDRRRCRVVRWSVGCRWRTRPGWDGQRRPPLPAARPGRPGRRAEPPVAGGSAVAREQAPARAGPGRSGRVAGVHGLGGRPRCVVVVAVARQGGHPLGVPAGMGCGPSAAQAGSGRSRLVVGSAVTWGNGWWACQDLNLGPHPYQLNAGNRCAHRPFPRSRLTVRTKGMRSISPLVCVHLSWW
jgi:hypothetical protein